MTPNTIRNAVPRVAACVDCMLELTPAASQTQQHPTATHVCLSCGRLYDVNRDRVALVAMNQQKLKSNGR